MKTIFYMLVALFMIANLTSCTADSITDEQSITGETIATTGDNSQYDDEDSGGN